MTGVMLMIGDSLFGRAAGIAIAAAAAAVFTAFWSVIPLRERHRAQAQ
jgi:HAMP domain-containing protein